MGAASVEGLLSAESQVPSLVCSGTGGGSFWLALAGQFGHLIFDIIHFRWWCRPRLGSLDLNLNGNPVGRLAIAFTGLANLVELERRALVAALIHESILVNVNGVQHPRKLGVDLLRRPRSCFLLRSADFLALAHRLLGVVSERFACRALALISELRLLRCSTDYVLLWSHDLLLRVSRASLVWQDIHGVPLLACEGRLECPRLETPFVDRVENVILASVGPHLVLVGLLGRRLPSGLHTVQLERSVVEGTSYWVLELWGLAYGVPSLVGIQGVLHQGLVVGNLARVRASILWHPSEKCQRRPSVLEALQFAI